MKVRDIRGNWDIQQGGFLLHVQITDQFPDGRFDGRINVHGKAGFTAISEERVTGNEISFLMGRGRYLGNFNFEGRLTGTTFDVERPGEQSDWVAEAKFPRFVFA